MDLSRDGWMMEVQMVGQLDRRIDDSCIDG